MRLGLTIVAVLGLLGCASAEDASGAATDDFIDMDTPPGNCPGTGPEACPDPGASTGVPEGGACRDSGDCAEGTHCIAPFVEGDVGDFVCTAQCIALDDESAWCLDASACCTTGAVCSARGLCVEGGLDDSGTAGDSGSDSGSGTAGSGTAGEATGSGTTGGSSSGTDTGASTGTTGAMGAG